MNSAVFRRVLFRTCWLPFLGASVAAGIQAWFNTGELSEFRAVGRVIVKPVNSEASVAFYGAQMELLQGGHLMRRVMDRMRGMHPELKPCEVQVQVTQSKEGPILNVLMAGTERKFTHGALDALLDEFVAYHKELRDATLKADSAKLNAAMSDCEKRLQESKAKFEEASKSMQEGELLAAERMRLGELVSRLRGEFESLKGSFKSTEAIEPRLKDAEARLHDVTEKAATASEKALGLEPSKAAYQDALREQEEAKAKLQWLAQAGRIEPVTILERPADAVQTRPDLVLPFVISGVLGFVGGLLLMLFISLVVALKPRPPAQPPALS